MKNSTLRSLYLTLLVVLFSGTATLVNAQGTNCAALTTPGNPASFTPTSSWQTLTTQSNRYYTFTATAGCTYTFSHCQGGGTIPAGTDPALTITDASNAFMAYNDDGVTCGSGQGSEIVWTAPANGTYRLHHEKCCCTQAGASNFATMAYKVECPCDPGIVFASPTALCAGGSTTLSLSNNSSGSTIQWQVSTDSVNYNNIVLSGSTITYGPLVADTFFFRALVTCSGVNNTVGTDTTNVVKVIVRGLPVINFPPFNALCCNSAPVTLNATPTGGTYTGPVTGNIFTPSSICNGSGTVTYTYTDNFGCTNTASQTATVSDTPTITFPPLTPRCYSNSNFPLNTALPGGGTYSGGTYVAGNTFFIPSPGTFNVIYTYTANGCTSQTSQNQVINPTPNIQFTPIPTQCIQNPGCIQLMNYVNTTTGTWSGQGVSNNTFCPNTVSSVGTYTLTYSDTNQFGCTAQQTTTVFVEGAPGITFNSLPTLCCNSPVLTLNPFALPFGGQFTGPVNLVGSNYQFNPAGFCGSTQTITYTYTTTSGCSATASQNVVVNNIPTVSTTGPVPAVCAGSAPFSLTPYVTPAGGTFSGCSPYVTGTNFNPTTATTCNVVYTYVDLSVNCANSTSFQVQVNQIPVVNMPTNLPAICENEGLLTLGNNTSGFGTPLGGTYFSTSGGVIYNSGNSTWYFNPILSGADTFVVYYNYTNGNLCTGTDSSYLVVHPSPSINFPPPADVCEDDAPVLLQAVPAGGTFSGTGITGNNFDPSVGPGNYLIRYIYVDQLGTGCRDTAYQNIIVKPRPSNITISNIVNPTTCGANNGSFRINGMAPNTQYQLTYNKNGPLINGGLITSTAFGTYIVSGLNAANYSNITVALNGCGQLDPSTAFAVLTDPNAPAAPTASANTPLCQFSTLQLTATSGVTNGSYAWTGPNLFGSNQQNPSIPNVGTNASGTYNVTVTNNLNCTSLPGTVTVTVLPAPNLTVSSNAPVCAGSTLNLVAGSTTTGTTFYWSGPSAFQSLSATPSIPNVSPANDGWYRVVATGPNGCTRADSVDVNVGTVTPATPVAGSNSPVCSGSTLSLTASNSTTGATYSWTGPNFTSTLQNPTRPAVTVADSGDYTVVASLVGCLSAPSTVHVSVIQSLSPNISITANPDDTVCFGTNIVFTSVITDGGTNPQYQWYKNGIPVIGAIDSFWGSPYLTDLDTVYAVLVNATTCTTASADTSNKLAVHMSPNTIPTVQVSNYPFTFVEGQSTTWTATVLNGGTNPAYQWYLNGSILPGETNSTYTSSSLLSSDTLSVLVTSNAPCAIPNTATDNWNAILNLSVTAGGKIIEDMKLYPNPNSGTFTLSGTFKGMQGLKDATVEVLNAVGQVVYSDNAAVNNGKINKQIRISDIAAGVYMIRVNADGQTSQLKFIVNK